MRIENPKISDAQELYQIEVENFGKEESTELETFKSLIKFPEEFEGYLIRVLKSNIVEGFYCTIEFDDKVELVDIVVGKDRQGRGCGRKLLEDCISKNAGKIITLKVRVDNIKAISLYEKFDFKVTEILPQYYGDVDGLRYERWESYEREPNSLSKV